MPFEVVMLRPLPQRTSNGEWAIVDSNHGPPSYQSGHGCSRGFWLVLFPLEMDHVSAASGDRASPPVPSLLSKIFPKEASSAARAQRPWDSRSKRWA
jgi:hypothetical protein